MIEVDFVSSDGSRERVYGREGYSLMEVAVRAGIAGIRAECGGACACATCHVAIAPEWSERVGPPHLAEDMLLDSLERTPTSRLACQVKLKAGLNGLEVRVPEGNG